MSDIILYVQEFAISREFRDILNDLKERLALLCFDEAHCITEWGTSKFRPDYGNMHEFFFILSATITETRLNDKLSLLNISKPIVIARKKKYQLT